MNCPTCSLLQTAHDKVVYEDAVCVALLSTNAAAVGHLEIIPKKHAETLEEIPDDILTQIFYVASYSASAVYEGLGAGGTNILCNNGTDSGAKGHLIIHVLPRKENDGISFVWESKALSPSEFEEVQKKIKDKTDYISLEKKKPAQQSVPSPSTVEVTDIAETAPQQPAVMNKDEDNYMIKHLTRIP